MQPSKDLNPTQRSIVSGLLYKCKLMHASNSKSNIKTGAGEKTLDSSCPLALQAAEVDAEVL